MRIFAELIWNYPHVVTVCPNMMFHIAFSLHQVHTVRPLRQKIPVEKSKEKKEALQMSRAGHLKRLR